MASGLTANTAVARAGTHAADAAEARGRARAARDLARMARDAMRRCRRPPRAALYYSCIARGANLFGSVSPEVALLRREIGDIPLAGMFCDGEVSNARLYGYTGVLALLA